MKLSPVPAAAMELEQHAHDISAAAAAHLLEHNPAIATRFGDDARAIWTEHLRQRVLELCAAMASGEVDLFVSCVTWSRTAMQARDVEAGDLDASLESLRAAVAPRLGGAPQEVVAACIDAAIAAVGSETNEFKNSTLDAGLMTGRIALRYIQAVIAGNAIPGMSIVLDAVDEGLGVPEAIFNVLLPAQAEVGRLWHVNEISIAEEHMVTMTTQRLMAVLASRASRAPDRGRTAVAAAVAGNIHEIGIRALGYLLEFEGWRTIYLGSDVPKSELPAAIECFDADIVLLSLALSSQLPALRRTIAEIRGKTGARVKIMVGGNGLHGAPDLWKELGADGYAVT
ncbi:MAG: cobalamin-dependent protein, partial [Gammaproteobacteria bacterium]|nr:cobalamin-dependent protein [Gammaproteobacteria bacterium]